MMLFMVNNEIWNMVSPIANNAQNPLQLPNDTIGSPAVGLNGSTECCFNFIFEFLSYVLILFLEKCKPWVLQTHLMTAMILSHAA